MTKLYPLPGFESFDVGRVGHWCPVKTGCTYGTLYDCNPLTSNNGTLTNFSNLNTAWVGSQYGSVLDFDGTNDHVNLGSSVLFHPVSFSVGGWCKLNTTAIQFQRFISSRSGLSTSDGYILSFTSGAPRFLVGNGTAFVAATANPDVATDTRWHHYIGTYSSGTSRFYIDGILQNSASVTVQHGNSTVLLGGDPSLAATVFLNGQIAEACLWNRALNPGEIQSLHQAGPGGAWTTEPPSRRYATLLASAYTLIAASASYSITGQPVGLLAGRLLTADAASYLLAGNSTGLNAGRMLTADFAAYSLTGQDANLLAGRLLSGDTAAYDLVGSSANLLASRTLQANSAQFTVTGSDAALLAGRLLDCGSSAFLLSPNQAGLLAARKLTADQASILLSTQAASLYAGRKISADAAQFILIASPVDLTFGGGGVAPYYYLFLLGGSR